MAHYQMLFETPLGERCCLCQPNSSDSLLYTALLDLHEPCPYCFYNDFDHRLSNFEVGFNRAGEMMLGRPGSQTVKVCRHGNRMDFELVFQVAHSPVDSFAYYFIFNKVISSRLYSLEELEQSQLTETKIKGQANATGFLALEDKSPQGQVVITAFIYDL